MFRALPEDAVWRQFVRPVQDILQRAHVFSEVPGHAALPERVRDPEVRLALLGATRLSKAAV